jgi:hypothetical protein
VIRDATRLTWAWAQTCNQVFFDTVQVMATLNRDVTDSFFGSLGGTRSYDRSGKYDRSSRYERSGHSEKSGRTDRSTKSSSRSDENAVNDITGSISHALRNTADIVARSGETFSRLYDEERADEPSTSGGDRVP